MWANRGWLGGLFATGTKPRDFLGQYSRGFSTVEGNTTFYALPSTETVAMWREDATPGFRFAFKFPRAISHDAALRDAEAATAAFFERLAPLGSRLGPFFLQLPPRFDDLAALERFLVKLPREFRYAVEPRHPAFFDEGPFEGDFHDALRELGMDRVTFDTRHLMAIESDDSEIREAQRKKPKCPPRFEALGPHPFLRYAGDPDVARDRAHLEEWADVVAGWIEAGRTPYVFMHQAPEDVDAPQLARFFHDALRRRLPDLPPLPPWPGESEPEQLTLF